MVSEELQKELKDVGFKKKPTLNNLCDACEGWFNSLFQDVDNGCVASGMDSTIVGSGEERDEAVARLVLKLAKRGVIFKKKLKKSK